MGRFAGLDLGEKRIGVAVSDEGASIAFPHSVILASSRMGRAVDQVLACLAELEVSCVVVGMPFDMDGSRGDQARKVEAFVRELKVRAADSLEVREWDERLSTMQATRVMREAGLSSRKQRGLVDKVAAALVLQSFLDSRQRPQ